MSAEERKLDQDLSQTFFAESELLYEEMGLPEAPSAEQPQVKSGSKKWMLGLGLLAVVLVGVGLLALMMRQSAQPFTPDISTDQNVQRSLTPLQNRVMQLSAELDDADPSRDLLPFPPINLDASLE